MIFIFNHMLKFVLYKNTKDITIEQYPKISILQFKLVNATVSVDK